MSDRREPFFVGLSGKAGSGKSTGGKMLRDFLKTKGINAQVRSFAGALREECKVAFPNLDWYQKPTPPLMRTMLRTWGQLRREQNPNYWINTFMRSLRDIDVDIIIIDDLRFYNEAMYMLTECEDRVLFRIHTPDNRTSVSADISETNLDNFDYFTDVFTVYHGELDKFVAGAWSSIRGHDRIIELLGEAEEKQF